MPFRFELLPSFQGSTEVQRGQNVQTLLEISYFSGNCQGPGPGPSLLCKPISGTSDEAGGEMVTEKMEQPCALVFKPLSHAVHCRIKGFPDEGQKNN